MPGDLAGAGQIIATGGPAVANNKEDHNGVYFSGNKNN